MATKFLGSEIKLGNYGSVVLTSSEDGIHMVFKSTSQELNLSAEDAYYLGNALVLHASEHGPFSPEEGEE